ncbi:hypothetical protein E4U22_004753 [Claviceps purpurea]|nr:hypothetical protein E4U44_005768 [Claviceps purpurea]KAG6319252.1 hypothetical protein E4U22_004753 [Claviceps purpurea]
MAQQYTSRNRRGSRTSNLPAFGVGPSQASRGDTAYVVHFDDLTQQMPQSRGIHVKFAGIVGNFTELLGHNSQNPVLS